MAELSKISGVAIGDVAAVDAVLKANIASILGLTLPSGAAYLLDTYTGAAAGYSVRRIASGATNLMRIREDSGDTETDIGYDSNGDLDTAAIATHCGSANGYVVTWYDQAGSNNATQSTAANQPQIYDGTAVITENGKPAVKCTGGQLLTGMTAGSITGDFYFLHVWTYDGNVPSARTMHFGTGAHQLISSTTVRYQIGGNRNFTVPTMSVNDQILSSLHRSSSTMAYAHQGSAISSVSDSTALALTRVGHTSPTSYRGVWQEVIMWDANHTSNRSAIETNINSEYLIYQPTDTPTSGLLATYSGAAAAYSVRQLADTAVISMTVRRDSDDEEKRFGFDANGDLDTAGIASFCGSANGYVSQWWDQSTSGNHASQGTAASQPQIYNGTAVVTENGKPALDFDGSNDNLEYTTTASATTLFVVQQTSDTTGMLFSSQNTGSRWHWILQDGGTSTDTSDWRNPVGDYGYKNGALVATQATTTRDSLHTALADGNQNLTSWTGFDNALADDYFIGKYFSAGFEYAGKLQEVVLYNTDQSGNRSGIETNINNHFSIY